MIMPYGNIKETLKDPFMPYGNIKENLKNSYRYLYC